MRARLDALRVSDLAKLRRVLRRLVTVEVLPWTGSGKPNADTARQRVKVTDIDHEEFVSAA